MVEAGVDDPETMVAKSSGNGFGPSVVAVEAGSADDDAVGALHKLKALFAGPSERPTDSAPRT